MSAREDEWDHRCIVLKAGQELRVGTDPSCDLPVSVPKSRFAASRYVPPSGTDVARVSCSLDGKIFITIFSRMLYVYANGFRVLTVNKPIPVKPGYFLSFGVLWGLATYRFFTADTCPVSIQSLVLRENIPALGKDVKKMEMTQSSFSSSVSRYYCSWENKDEDNDLRASTYGEEEECMTLTPPHDQHALQECVSDSENNSRDAFTSQQHPVVPYVVEMWGGRAMLHSVFQKDCANPMGKGQSCSLKDLMMSVSGSFEDTYMTFNGRYLLKSSLNFCYETPIHSVAVSILDSIEDAYNQQDGTFMQFTIDTKKLFMTHFFVLAEHVLSLLKASPLTVRCCSPIVCCGDIHGSFADLKFIVDNVMPFRHWSLMTTPVMFLGDYVDRGLHDVEVILYLLAWYALCPDSVILLRGNHEDEEVNGDVSYYGESSFLTKCRKFFGEEDGELFWTRVNDVFENLPIMAIIDGTFLACHGGIPLVRGNTLCGGKEDDGMNSFCFSDGDSVKDNDIPHEELLGLLMNGTPDELRDVRFRRLMPVASDSNLTAQRRRLVRELLWNDPIGQYLSSQSQLESQSQVVSREYDTPLLQSSVEKSVDTPNATIALSYDGFNEYGFRSNIGRGVSGNVIREFSMLALDTFMRRWGFTLLIRAHQQKMAGVEMGFAGSVLTLFSCSNYTGDTNRAGACIIANKKVRPVSWRSSAGPQSTASGSCELRRPARSAIPNFDMLIDSFCSTYDSVRKPHQVPSYVKLDTVRVG